jgi:glycosyltransferase involved in cell wall biosynthesis
MADILLICEYPTLNGGERSMLSTLTHITSAGHRVRVAAPPSGDLADELRRQAIEHVPLNLCDESGKRLEQPHARECIRQAICDTSPDLVHANSLSMGRLLGPVAASQQVRSIGHLRDIIRVSRKTLDDLNQNTRLIAVSYATREYHVANGLDAARTHVIHNGVDLASFSPDSMAASLRRELGISDDTLLVATIGQVIARKGTDLFVDAAVSLTNQHPNAHFLVIGDCYSRKQESQEFVANLHRTASEHNVQTNIHFLGCRSDVAEILNQVDIVVQPSRQDPLCRVLLEAAAAGRAIVTTNVGGTLEIFPPDSDTAIVVESDHVDTLTAAIDTLLNDRDRRIALGNKARRRAEEAFDVQSAVAELLRHYEEVLQLTL